MRLRFKMNFLLMVFVVWATVGLSAVAQAILISTIDNVTLESWTTRSYSGSVAGYDYWYKITNKSGKDLDYFAVYLNSNTTLPVFWADYFGWNNTMDKLPTDKTALLHAWLTEFNPPQPTPQQWGATLLNVNGTSEIGPGGESVAPILLMGGPLQPSPEPSTLLLLVSGLIGVIGFGRKRLIKKV